MKSNMVRMRYACAVMFALWMTVLVPAGHAQPRRESITLARAIELAGARSPAVAALAAEVDALRNRNEVEALSSNLVLESEFENFAGTGAASGTDLLDSTLRLSKVLELGGKRSRRRDVGSAELDSLTADHQLRRDELAAEVARRFIAVLADQAILETARRASELARTARDVARERVSAGASSPAALGRSQIALARAQIAQQLAEQELASSRVKLSVLWADDAADSFGEVEGNLFDMAQLEPFDAYQAQMNASPELASLASQARVEDARIRLARAQRLPDVSVSAGVRRLEAVDDQALVASFSVPLGTRRRAELRERAARADRARVDAELESRRLELMAVLFDLYQEIRHARTEAESLNEQVRPQAEAMLQTTIEGYRVGRFSPLELTDAQLQLVEVERAAIRAAAQFHTLLVEIQRTIGAPIETLAVRSSP